MKKYDSILLKNAEPYRELNLSNDCEGVVLDKNNGIIKAIFFNPKNIGQYLITNVYEFDCIKTDNEISPQYYEYEFKENYDLILKHAVEKFSIPKVNEFDWVKLNVEKPKYAKEGIHKGEIGCVMSDHAFQNCVEVDFINFDDSMAVDMDDLEVIKRREDK